MNIKQASSLYKRNTNYSEAILRLVTLYSKDLRSYWKKGLYIFTAIFIGKLFSFFWKLIIAKSGVYNLGYLELILTILTVLPSLSLLGLHTSLIRFVSIFRSSNKLHKVGSLITFVILLSLSISLAITLITFVFPQQIIGFLVGKLNYFTNIKYLVFLVPFIVFNEILWGFLVAIKKIKTYSLLKYISSPFIRLFFGVLLLSFSFSIMKIINWSVAFGVGLSFIFTLILVKNLVKLSFNIDKKVIIKYLKYSFPMSGSFIAYSLYGSLDILLLSRFSDIFHVGFYTAIIMFADSLDLFLMPFQNLIHTYLGQYYKNFIKGINFIIINIIFFLVISLCLVLFLILFKEFLIGKILGGDYLIILPYFGYFLIIKTLNSSIVLPLRDLLDFYGYVKITFWFMVISLVVKLFVGIMTIPNWGLYGVIISQGASIGIHLSMCIFFLLRLKQHKNKSILVNIS